MLSSWFRALRDPASPASDPNDRDSKDDEDSNSKYESNSGVNVASLRSGGGGPGQRTNSECGFDGSAAKTVNGEGRDLIEPYRNGVNKQEYSTPTSGIETQNEIERYKQQKNFREDSKQGHGSDDDEMSISPPSQNQEDGMTSNRLQETTTTHPIHPSSGNVSSKDVSKGGEESGAPPVQAQVHGGHTSYFFASLFGAGEKAASSMEASPNVQNNNQNGQTRSSREGKEEEDASSSLIDDEDDREKEMTLFSSPGEDSKRQDSENKRSIDDFSMVRVLGQGSYGKVVLVRKKDDGVLYAMKVFNKHDVVCKRQVERTKIERRVLGYVDHPFLMKLQYAFQTGRKLYLVLDYCPGGELFFHLSRFKRFPESVVRFYSAELVLALQHLHDSGIIYRDIKPENILLDRDGHLKLGDFGLAKDGINQATSGAQSVCGTPEYMAPEVISKAGHGTAVDWWGLGMLMYEMLTGLPPWYTKDRQKLFERLRSAPLVIPKTMSRHAASIISGMLTRNPARRLGAGGPKQVMGHDFFRGLDWQALLEKRINAPLNPCRNQSPDSLSTQNFDPQFTRMPLNTVSAPGSAGDELSFDGFSYVTEVGLAEN